MVNGPIGSWSLLAMRHPIRRSTRKQPDRDGLVEVAAMSHHIQDFLEGLGVT